MLKNLFKDPIFIALLLFGIGFEIWFQSVYFPTKGDIFTSNFSTFEVVQVLREKGIGQALIRIFFERYDKGTSVLLFQFPLMALGFGPIESNRVLVVIFSSCCLIFLYQSFRFHSKPWVSAVSALTMESCELIFKNLNEYDTFIGLLAFLPGVYVFLMRRQKKIGSHFVNSLGLVLCMFICITFRPEESFFIALAGAVLIPSSLLIPEIWIGYLFGLAWWFACLRKLEEYSRLTKGIVHFQEVVLSPNRFFNLTTIGLFLILVSLLPMWRKLSIPIEVRISLLASVLMSLFLIKLGMIEDDYLLVSFFLFIFSAIRFIQSSLDVGLGQWRAKVMALFVLIFFLDQGYAIVNGRGISLSQIEIARKVPRLNQKLRPVWNEFHRVLPNKAQVGIVFYPWREIRETLRPVWGTLQSLALEDHSDIHFTFPRDLKERQAPIELADLCQLKLTHLLLFFPETENVQGAKPIGDEIFLFESHPLPLGVQSQYPQVALVRLDSDPISEIQATSLMLLKLPCE